MLASQALLRFALLVGFVVLAVVLIVAHGVRGIAVLVAILLVLVIPRSRSFGAIEDRLVRLTGSRRRAAALIGFIIIGSVAAFNVYQVLHGG
jgi:hypothetical protein